MKEETPPKTAEEIKQPKPVHVKPSFYAFVFYDLKEIALEYGYNLSLHGSLARDLDIIAIPWAEKVGDERAMIEKMAEKLGGVILEEATKTTHHGRKWYVINLNRQREAIPDGDGYRPGPDPQYYVDISVMPASTPTSKQEGEAGWTDHKILQMANKFVEDASGYYSNANATSWAAGFKTGLQLSATQQEGRREEAVRWVKVTESLPDYNDYVLWYLEDGNMVVQALAQIATLEWREFPAATYWMPLPSLPATVAASIPPNKGKEATDREINAFPWLSIPLEERIRLSGPIKYNGEYIIEKDGHYWKIVPMEGKPKSEE